MADTAAPAPVAASPKKASKAASSKKPRIKPAHPKTADMVNSAIKNLKERGGSSLQAIKKYIASNYKVDAEKLAPFIRKHLKAAVVSGALVQTKGKGASGSFKLAKDADKAPATKVTPKKKAPAEKKPKAAAKEKKPAAKKATGAAKKAVAAKKKPAVEIAAKKPKSPSKVKKAKAPAAKKPKPKKTVAKKSSPKKAAPKKK